MSRIIVFSDFVKSEEKKHVINNLEYISTREGVKLNNPEISEKYSTVLNPATSVKPVSENQKNIIASLTGKDSELKNTFTYQDYVKNSNMYSASKFIAEATEFIAEKDKSNEIYLNYISERPGVVKNEKESHGLFDAAGAADKDKYKKELSSHTGNIWRDIISLRREDAIATGFDNQEAWIKLLSNKMPSLAESLGIPEKNFRWCAAFHDEGYHPHVHVMFWDQSGIHGFQNIEAIEGFKSKLANSIFANEMYLHKELKNIYRQDVEDEFRIKMDGLLKESLAELKNIKTNSVCVQLNQLADQLNDYGKKVYSYQSPEAKLKCDEIVESIVTDPKMKKSLIQYLVQSKALAEFYMSKTDNFVQDSLDKIIHPGKEDRKVLHNIVIKAAYEIKALNYAEKIQLDEHFPSLLRKMNHSTIRAIENTDALLKAQVKLGLTLNMSPSDIIDLCKRVEPNDEEILEAILFNKNEHLDKNDIRILNKVYDLHIDENKYTYQPDRIRIARSMITDLVTMFNANAVEEQKEVNRLRKARRIDEAQIRRSRKS